ncbi:amidinotransferase [Hyaloraphidium curvatum]|nr:amidinotransferase [Hyaloraphidium curvatum]
MPSPPLPEPASTAKASATTFTRALVRDPAESIVDGLRAVDHGAPSFEAVVKEHESYCAALKKLGVRVDVLPALPAFPDSVFVEDTSLVFPEGAILLRPGHPTRAGETPKIAPAIRDRFKTVLEMRGPGTADGGDVMTLGDRVLIGLSERTSEEGAKELIALLAQLGRKGVAVRTPPGVLHFKSDSSPLGDSTVLSTVRLAASGVFEGLKVVLVPEGEEGAANCLMINGTVLMASGFPGTVEVLRKEGYPVHELDVSEIAKVDAGLSCMSLRWREPTEAR